MLDCACACARHNLACFTPLPRIRRQKEFEEVRECTFKPTTNAGAHQASLQHAAEQEAQLARVKGVNTFMQHRDRKRKLDQEKQQRENELFHLERKYDAQKHD